MTVVYRITGKDAAIDGLTCLKQWQIALQGGETVAACSASAGAVLRSDGNYDWGGGAWGYGLPPKLPGEYFTFTGGDRDGQGWVSAENGAIVSNVKIVVPVSAGRNIYYQMSFMGSGTLTKGAAVAADSTTPNPLNAKAKAFYIGATAVSGVEAFSLEIDGNITDPVYNAVGAGWPARDPGNIDATVSWRQTFDAMTQLPAINDTAIFKLYVTATTYYEVKWAKVLRTPAVYEIEGEGGKPDYVRCDGVAKFTGYHGGAQGYIKLPAVGEAAAVQYWPET